MNDNNLYWFIAQYKSRSFIAAQRNLVQQGFETFLPFIKTTKLKGNFFITEEKPLFPSYIFVSSNLKNLTWRAINSTYGISKVIRFGDKPSMISSNVMNVFKAKFIDEKLNSNKNIKQGDKIKVINGPFTNFFFIIENIDEKKRIWVLIDLLGGFRRASLLHNQIMPA